MTKLLAVMLVLTVVPLIILGTVAVRDAKKIGMDTADDARLMGETALIDSTDALQDLGKKIIEEKAESVAKQMEIYIKDHPEMTVEDLQNDEYFSSIAVQPVGETGYTAITDVDSLVCRFHASEGVVNLDLHKLAETLPGFWGVMSQSEGGKEVFGYYDWAEADGSINQKYMHISIVDAQTADEVTFSVAATTYIEEFSSPVRAIEEKNSAMINSTIGNIRASTEGLNTQNTILALTMITIIVVIVGSVLCASYITNPIKQLKDAADKVTSGDFDTKLPPAKGNDEVAELIGSMEMLITAFKFAKKSPRGKKK